MILYLRMLRLLSSLREQFSGDSRRNKAIKRKRKALTTTVFMVGSFLLGWVPACLFYLMTSHYWHEQFRRIPVVLITGNFCVNFLLIAKFLLNPLIYAVRVPEIKALLWKHGLVRQFSRRRSSGDGEETTTLYDSFVVHVGGSAASSNLRSLTVANANSVNVENEVSIVDFDRYDMTKITKQL